MMRRQLERLSDFHILPVDAWQAELPWWDNVKEVLTG